MKRFKILALIGLLFVLLSGCTVAVRPPGYYGGGGYYGGQGYYGGGGYYGGYRGGYYGGGWGYRRHCGWRGCW